MEKDAPLSDKGDGPRGWHSRGYLPHFDAAEVVQAIAFRLGDSLPAEIVRSLQSDPLRTRKLDGLLDNGRGSCVLRHPVAAGIVEQALLHFDSSRYRLYAWCVMPNHVHVVAEPVPGESLGAIVRSWKVFTAKAINRELGRSGPLWHEDYFDRFIRNDEHFARVIAYVEHNPVKAGLVKSADEWRWSSARWRKTNR